MTAEELIRESDVAYCNKLDEREISDLANIMKEYAKQVAEAVKQECYNKATMTITYPPPYEDANENGRRIVSALEVEKAGEYGHIAIDINSILSINMNQFIK